MRIGGVSGPAAGAINRRTTAAPQDTQIAQSRALIAVEGAAPVERSPVMTRHPAAPFLAQLIATRMQAPQTRARRRATPGEAVAVYALRKSEAAATGWTVRQRS